MKPLLCSTGTGYLLLGFAYGCKTSKDLTFFHNFLDLTLCFPTTSIFRSSINRVITLYCTSSTLVFARNMCTNKDKNDKTRPPSATHLILDLNIIRIFNTSEGCYLLVVTVAPEDVSSVAKSWRFQTTKYLIDKQI